MSAAPPPSSGHLAGGLLAIGLGASLAPLDFAVNVAFPAMTAAFSLPTSSIRWVAVCYVLTYGSLMLGFGALGDRIGYVKVFRAGLVLAALSFALCVLAPRYEWLLAARVVQGVSVALTLSCAPALATLLVAPERRTWALSAYAAMSSAAAVTAPLIGGLCLALFGWQGVFGFRLPIALLALACVPLLARGLRTPPSASSDPFDWAGTGLLACSVALLLVGSALIRVPSDLLLAAPLTLAGALLMVMFVRRERARPKPFMPAELARSADFRVINLAAIVVQFTCFSVPLISPYFLLKVREWSPLQCGLLLAWWSVGSLAGSSLAPRVIQVLGVRPAAGYAGAAIAMGLLGVALWSQGAGMAFMGLTLLLHGVGMGLFQVAYSDLVMGALPASSRGVAGSLTMVTRTAGIVLGASIWLGMLQTFEPGGASGGPDAAHHVLTGFGLLYASAGIVAGLFFLVTARRWRGVPK